MQASNNTLAAHAPQGSRVIPSKKSHFRCLNRALGLAAICLLAVSCRQPQPTALTAQSIPLRATDAAPIPDFGQLPAPADNPVTQGKVELGFRLWFEPRLSANNSMTCAHCHNQTMGFSNAQTNAAGVTGVRGARNVPTIYGSLYQHDTFWDGRAKSLEAQALGPIENPIEMNEKLDRVLQKLAGVPYYQQKFREVFNSAPSAEGIAKALASFERALTMAPTPYEKFQAGDQQALSPAQQRGMELFFSARTRCSACHQGSRFTNNLFVNIGIGMDKPNPDLGHFAVTNMPWDRGSFKTPTLLNVALTAPYMHDGSLSTLEAVVDHYDKGGIPNEALDPRIRPLQLTAQQKADLVAFLRSLSAPDNLKALGKLPGIHLPAPQLNALLDGKATTAP